MPGCVGWGVWMPFPALVVGVGVVWTVVPPIMPTHVDVCSHTRAVVLDSWIPLHEIGESDLLETDDLSTRHAFGDPMALRTVHHYSRLCRLWGATTFPGVIVWC
jgi:hypothetical protein